MSDLPRTVTANAQGAGTITFADVPTGVEWVISQIGIETLPFVAAGCSAVVRKNGRFVTSSNQAGSASAGGQPYFLCRAGDSYTVEFTGGPANGSLVAVLYYNEQRAGTSQGQVGVI